MNRGFALCALLLGLGVATACGPDQGPPYGGANALQGVSTPILAAKAGSCGTEVSDNNCSVKFANDIMPILKQNGCVSCHQSTSLPRLTEEAAATYESMLAWTLNASSTDPAAPRYLNPCSKDAKASFFLCNLQKDGATAKCGIHMPTGGQISDDALAKVKTWVECGAPKK